MKVTITLIALLLAGCTSTPGWQTETIYLQNTDGEVVQCGPYGDGGKVSASQRVVRVLSEGPNERIQKREYLFLELRQCVTDYQQAGYKRIKTLPDENGSVTSPSR